MDTEKIEKERRNQRFAREELGDLLKLFSGLGFTVTAGIVGFFMLGHWLNGKLAAMGYSTYGIPLIVIFLGGLALTIYWAYLRIARHLEKYEAPPEKPAKKDEAKAE